MSKNVVKLAAETVQEPIDILEDVLAHLRTAASDAGDNAKDALEKAAHAVGKVASQLADDARRESGKLVKKAGAEVKAHPVATAAIASAAVALAGLLVAHQIAKHRDQ